MVYLKLLDNVTGDILHIDKGEYGVIMEKYLKLAPAISSPLWILVVVNRYGDIVKDSSDEQIH